MIRLRSSQSLLLASLFLVGAGAQAQSAPTAPVKPVLKKATGTFTVNMLPPPPASESSFLRLFIEKDFDGDLRGKSRTEMLASNGGDQPSGGYVALERFTGTLAGREGSFILQHSGIMSPGSMSIQVLITPGSGTGALAGIEGKLQIRIEGKQHFYDLEYSFPR